MQAAVPHLQTLDYAAVAAYIALMAAIGVVTSRFVRDVGSYLKGNSAIPWVVAATSNFMALFSTFVFVAYAGIAYEHGLVAVTVYWSTVPACALGGWLFAARWRRTGMTTPTEYLEARYSLGLRQVVTWTGLLMRFLDNMIRLYAIGLFITAATPLSLAQAVVLSGLIVTVMNLGGGVWSVVVMSTVQCVILLLCCLILVPLAVGAAGGMAALAEKIPNHLGWFHGPKGQPLWLAVFYFSVFIKFNENWTFIQRYYCVRDERAALKVGLVSGLLFLLCSPVFLFPAVAARAILPGLGNPEMSYVALSLALLPAGVMGLMFSSMFAATMSTLNAEYNTMAAVLVTDVYKRLIHPSASDRQMLWLARVSTAAVGLLVIGGALVVPHLGGAFEANKLFTGILAIPIGIPLLLGILFRRPNALSATLTIVIGVAAGVILNSIGWLSWEAATLAETLLSLAVYFSPFLWSRRGDGKAAQVDALFAQLARPIAEEDKPLIAAATRRSVSRTFALSMVVAGVLFAAVSLPSLTSAGGALAMAAGLVCLAGAAVLALGGRDARATGCSQSGRIGP